MSILDLTSPLLWNTWFYFIFVLYWGEDRQVKVGLCGIQRLEIETPCFLQPRCGADSPGLHISSPCPKNDLNPDIEKQHNCEKLLLAGCVRQSSFLNTGAVSHCSPLFVNTSSLSKWNWTLWSHRRVKANPQCPSNSLYELVNEALGKRLRSILSLLVNLEGYWKASFLLR